MRLRPDVAQVFRDYPRIYFACHRRHVRDPKTGTMVSQAQVSILDHLDADTPTVLGDLAQHMGAVGRLVGLAYVDRVVDPIDRRKVQLRLTDAGVRICAANSVLEPSLVEAMLDQLNAAERKAALHGLSLLGKAAVASQQARAKAETSGKRPRRKSA
jgi:MarR family transcriptional regulator, organic hydroperoxide resistance regulator